MTILTRGLESSLAKECRASFRTESRIRKSRDDSKEQPRESMKTWKAYREWETGKWLETTSVGSERGNPAVVVGMGKREKEKRECEGKGLGYFIDEKGD